MAYTQADLDKLDAQLLGSVKKVTFSDGRSTENYDLDQLRRLRAEMKAEIAAAASQVTPRLRTTVGRIVRR
jgi:hypothetical protein